MATLKGYSNLKARLDAVSEVPGAFAAEWANDTAQRIRRSAPHSDRPQSKIFTPKATRTRGAVFGAFWWIFVDRGTKAHDIEPRKKQSLKFTSHGRTIFAKRVHKKRQARRPFISKAAQGALTGSQFADLVVKSWNRRKLASRKRFL